MHLPLTEETLLSAAPWRRLLFVDANANISPSESLIVQVPVGVLAEGGLVLFATYGVTIAAVVLLLFRLAAAPQSKAKAA